MLEKSYEYMKQELGDFVPDTAIILGSGLGDVVEAIENPRIIPYANVPFFPTPTVGGHKGQFCAGKIGKHNVLCLQGRFHFYEGIDVRMIYEIIRMLKLLGIKQLIITNAAGSLRMHMPAGSIMLIADHINMSGTNPLIGVCEEPYFPDMSQAYDLEMRNKFMQIADEERVPVFQGVYMMLTGPNYETPAEVRMLQMFNVEAVGMSTVPEVISAAQLGLKVMGISVISNLATGMDMNKPNHNDVLLQVGKATKRLSRLITRFLEKE
ncbi:MAG: purine-nucleoside phosphorylase [Alphaproteobacteria bacterium]|jgi:purine-nucleoside phosphorylase|nr:purine-nucleoside phosphorylase [Alphaproteobacteria bacterium]